MKTDEEIKKIAKDIGNKIVEEALKNVEANMLSDRGYYMVVATITRFLQEFSKAIKEATTDALK